MKLDVLTAHTQHNSKRQNPSSIALLPRIETNLVWRMGLLCSELDRIASIPIMPATLSRERFMQALTVMEQMCIMEGHQMGALTSTVTVCD